MFSLYMLQYNRIIMDLSLFLKSYKNIISNLGVTLGTLELVVTTAKTSVRAEVQARSRGLYDVTFVPQEISPHFVNITFNDQEIKNSPFQCKIVDEREKDSGHHNEKFSDLVLRGDGLRKASVGKLILIPFLFFLCMKR